MGQQGIPAIKHMCDRTELMLPQSDIRVHSHEMDMGSVVLPGTGGIEHFVILLHERLPSVRVFPYPIPECILDRLLFLCRECRFLLVKHPLFVALRILNRVIDTHIL